MTRVTVSIFILLRDLVLSKVMTEDSSHFSEDPPGLGQVLQSVRGGGEHCYYITLLLISVSNGIDQTLS